MIHRFWSLCVGLAVLLTATGAVSSNADVLHLKQGGRLEGVLTSETEWNVTIDVGMGRVTIPRGNVSRIERRESALSGYRNRLRAIAPGDVRAYAELARFASVSGLGGESRQMWARVLSLDPRNVEAHLALGHVLVDGNYVDEAEAYRANGFVYFDGRWMTPAEQSSLLRQRERQSDDESRIAEARRATVAAEDRARRAEAEAQRAREAAANAQANQTWGHGPQVIIGSPYWGGYTAGCYDTSCITVPQIWPVPPPPPVATPLPPVRPNRPASIR